MEEYIKTLLEQVRCKKAHALIEDEIRGHIEEQTEANIANGMSEEEAVKAAVHDMGDAVAAGIALDKVHRPEMAWDMVILVGVISIIGIIIHALSAEIYDNVRFALHTVIGFAAMLAVYRIDYSFMAKYAKVLAALMLGLSFIIVTRHINGLFSYTTYEDCHDFVFMIWMLYIPVYGAVLYQYYGTGKVGIIKSLLWFVTPIIFALGFPDFILAIILFFSMAVVLSFAVCKGWFKVEKKRFLLVFWGSIILVPAMLFASVMFFHWLPAYHEARIRGFFSVHSDIRYMADLIGKSVRECLADGRFIGGNGISGRHVPDVGSTYLLVYLMTSYGILAALFACVLLSFLTIKIFRISISQKNQLGMMMGCGCGMAFASSIVINVMENIGLFPPAVTFLPFLSSGGSNIVISYILVGIIMSVYRYKNILPKHFKRKKSIASGRKYWNKAV